jgi:PAS domain S-box-containing protein
MALAYSDETSSVLPGYTLREKVYRGRRRAVYRATRTSDGAPVIIKTALDGPAGAERLAREYELLRSLEIPTVPRALDLVRTVESLALVLEDKGQVRLKSLIPPGGLDLAWFLQLAIQLSGILHALHLRKIIHKDINPNNILVDPDTGELTLIDFSIATRMPLEHQEPRHPNVLEGTIAYLSPEQSGRMNRDLDYRTDLYSLGVTFYEMLTGRLPFESSDPLEIIHGHIARTPVSPHVLRPELPAPISAVVMKLLAKAAEERYQSALRLSSDLARCREEWQASGRIYSPIPSLSDFGDRFLLPQRLYGREPQLAQLMVAFELVAAGAAQLVLVSGYSGVGKSSLIRELYRPLVGRRGYFIEGKFDQIVRVPYGALLQAFHELIQQLLTEDEVHFSRWRDLLADALGAGAAVLAEVVPEIQLIIGTQPAAPVLGPAETQNRFRLVIQNFLRALAKREHPLVIFLDDLQWTDSATLNLLEPLLAGSDIECLLLIGAYRDNEVDATHALTRALSKLAAAEVPVSLLPLEPLALADLTLLVRDTLHCELDRAEPLARLVSHKTGGNPFFVGQFLKALRDAELLRFDYEHERWSFDIDAIAKAGMTDNVIDLMTRKIQRLSPRTQQILTLAACIGNPFDQQTLAIVSEQSSDAAVADLEEAINEGLILPTAAAGSYSFLHDRVQQSAYALIPEHRRQTVHLAVGRLLRSRTEENQLEERIFDLVHHLNLGRDLIDDGDERVALARLDLLAGQKAKASTAYEASLGYLKAGLELVDEGLWRSDYTLAFELHLEAAESMYLCGYFEDAEREFATLLQRAASKLDKARVYRLRSVQYENLSRYADALGNARESLLLFDVSFPDSPEERTAALEQEIASIHSLLGDRSIASLLDLPVMADPEIRMVLNILTDIWSSAYILGDPVLARLISATIVRLSLVHGNVPESAYGYVTHAITVGPVRGDYRSAYEFGRLALQVNERFHDSRRRAKIHQQFHAHVNLWRQPMASCIPHAREACRSGLESGDFLYAAYGASTEAWPAMLSTADLGEFVLEYEPKVALIRKLKATGFADSLKLLLNWARALQGKGVAPLSLSGDGIDEQEYVESHRDNPFFTTFHAVTRLKLCYMLGEYQEALSCARTARNVVYHLAGTIWPVEFEFWNGLTLAANYASAGAPERTIYREEIEAAKKTLAVLAENCPENFLCQSLLLSAELERVAGDQLSALDLFERAIRYAQDTGTVQHQALANELCGRFWLGGGHEQVAAVFLGEARQAYDRWGASAKVAELERRYGAALARNIPEGGRFAAENLTGNATTVATAGAEASSIDLVTVMKAARVLAGEIDLERLLEKLMVIALENAGAERGGLVLEHAGAPRVHAHGSGDRVAVKVHDAPALTMTDSLPTVIINYVRRTSTSLVLPDARADERYRHDPYLMAHQPRSVLCAPVVNQGRLLGVLYLENNLATGVFTPDRLAVIQLIAAQAAIAIQNAELYQGLRESQLRYSTLAETVPEVLYTNLPDGRCDYVSQRFLEFTGMRAEQAMGYGWADAVHPEDREPTLLRWEESQRSGRPFEAEFRFRRSDGTYRWFKSRSVPMRASDGPIVRWFGASSDIDDSKRTEEALRAALTEVAKLRDRLQAENIYLMEEVKQQQGFEEIVGRGPALQRVLHQVEQVAPADTTVLITGETGSGKELIARAIHNLSPRRERPMVTVNCGAISPGLVESELFGHEKGAFTGAVSRKIGRFELAHEGTLFLDEIGDLSPDLQVKLLRVLQEGELERVGGSRCIKVDVRVIAATHKDLEAAVQEGRFRADLYYRLNVFPIRTPALRERREDIPALVRYFAMKYATKMGKRIESVPKSVLDTLSAYDWPGNVRELANVLERSVIVSRSTTLELGDWIGLPQERGTRRPEPAPQEITRERILETLDATGWRVSGPNGAAQRLGLKPTTLEARMKRLGIVRPGAPSHSS